VQEKIRYWLKFPIGIILMFPVFLFSGCESKYLEPDEEMLGFSYFPLTIGSFRIYEVMDIKYTIQNTKDSTFYYLKEVVKDSFINQEGHLSHYLYRFTRTSDTLPWDQIPVYIWITRKTDTNLIVYEENVPFVKLTFPVKSGLSWNGNALNTLDPLDYYYSEPDLSLLSSYIPENHLIQVVQNNFDDLIIRRDVRNEIYAENIGLVYKESNVLEYCQDLICRGQQIIESGTEYRQTLVEYGKE